ncbi:MAG: M20/M25/M40 family metallo-hydrolase [Hominenteromicrobium sp.]
MDLERYIEQNEKEAVELLRTLCAIPAPSHHEEKRAAFCKAWLEAHGAQGVLIDEALNVVYPYRAEKAEKLALFMAHTDTVFPDTEPMALTERDGKLFCPGVGDDTANVALLMLMAAYTAQAQPETEGGIVFAFNSCEEGLGNLKGCRALMDRYGSRMEQVVSFDGYMEGICSAAVGSLRYRVAVRTEGGHSYAAFGSRNAIERLSAVIARLYAYEPPQDGSRTTFNVGRIEGGTSVNTIAQEAWMLYEFRSDNYDSLLHAKAYFERVLGDFRAQGLDIEAELLGERPCGKKDNPDPRQAALLARCAESVQKRAGFAPGFHPGSTDCNIPFSLGIPAATVGLCRGGGAHTREEWIETESLKAGFGIAADLISARFAGHE